MRGASLPRPDRTQGGILHSRPLEVSLLHRWGIGKGGALGRDACRAWRDGALGARIGAVARGGRGRSAGGAHAWATPRALSVGGRVGGRGGGGQVSRPLWGSLTVPRADAAGTRGRGVPGDGAWHWGVHAPDTVSTLPIGSARALSSGASHPVPSPWVELGSTQGVVWCDVV